MAMFSSRFKWNLETNRLARLREEKRRAKVSLLDLTESNPTRVGLDYPAQWLAALGQPQVLRYDPQAQGLESARQAIAEYYRMRGQAVHPDQLFLTASTSEAYAWLFKLLCEASDEVLVPQPSYPLFEFLATLEGVTLRPYELPYVHPRGWAMDFDALAAAVTPRTRAVIVVNPNNPTGSYLKRKEAAPLEAFCCAHQLGLIVDEVFSDYALAPDPERATDFSAAEPLTFVLNGFSKLLALPQMKLGWILVSGAEALRAEAKARLELIADTFLSVNTPVQLATPLWLSQRATVQQQLLSRVQTNLSLLAQRVAATPCRLLTMEGGWSAILEVPRYMPEEDLILRLLAEDDVLVHPGYFFDFAREAFLVLSLLPPPEIFRSAVEKILRHINR